MNTKQQKLLDQLKDALNNISKSPATSAEVELIFEDFVASLEEIADDLKTMSDEEIAASLKAIIDVTATSMGGAVFKD
jgi:hypothetical protein